jgi:hypothetical protein
VITKFICKSSKYNDRETKVVGNNQDSDDMLLIFWVGLENAIQNINVG